MDVLIIGSGGREHALGWAMARSEQTGDLYFAPGNAGTSELGTNTGISATDIASVTRLCRDCDIGLVIIGPEQPLVQGMADELRALNVPVVGPSAAAAQLEGSKSWSKDFMKRHEIPTAEYRVFNAGDLQRALSYVETEGAPIVVKASGLAGGKGAVVCNTIKDAQDTLRLFMEEHSLGSAGDEVVVESFMEGEEASVFVVSDGTTYVLLSSAQDHKRVGDGDTGPNTGGMGAYSPAPVLTPEIMERVVEEIIEPTLRGMTSDGVPYQGILYCGLMITQHGPMVVEYNCRLGDPEAQVILPLLKSDTFELFYRTATGTLSDYRMEVETGVAACVVMASNGYPGAYNTGKIIEGVELAASHAKTMVFHAGTSLENEKLITSGGRVLAVSCTGNDLEEAIGLAYSGCQKIHFEGAFFRFDIGEKSLSRMRTA